MRPANRWRHRGSLEAHVARTGTGRRRRVLWPPPPAHGGGRPARRHPGSAGTGSAGTTGGAGTTGTAGATGSRGTGGSMDAGVDHAPIAFEEQMLEIARDYISWGRVDDEMRWAPGLCRLPYPGVARPSMSNDPATHGQKLYSVFAKNWASYPNGPQDGQVVVKQSWTVEVVTGARRLLQPDACPAAPASTRDHFYPYAKGRTAAFSAPASSGRALHHVQARSVDARDRRRLGLRDRHARRPGDLRRPGRELHGLPRDRGDPRAAVRRAQERRVLIMDRARVLAVPGVLLAALGVA